MARNKEFNQEETLQKAMTVFWAKGYSATSMQDLVDGLGISRSSMYDTYGDKEALFYAALENYARRELKVLSSVFMDAESPLQGIQNLLSGIVTESIADTMHKGCFIVNAIGELPVCNAKVKTLVNGTLDKMTDEVATMIDAGQKAGQINTTHTPAQWAAFITNTIAGLRVAARGGADVKSLTDIAAVTISVLRS